ncbi:hypothetical protein [Rubricoccus marinus]|uniref:Uncharacterized protein n=1 Tax=Rubricoccus marinus TaxID=716817 RepID=A0A259U0H0_9BACT|nr:hypothetical protein [Rubricoccus marinus]OZC03513.1 hypothetical protein BSZ36_11285 [Rubricoccus marinus]
MHPVLQFGLGLSAVGVPVVYISVRLLHLIWESERYSGGRAGNRQALLDAPDEEDELANETRFETLGALAPLGLIALVWGIHQIKEALVRMGEM